MEDTNTSAKENRESSVIELRAKRMEESGSWVPACGGTEKEFTTRNGFRLLYVWHTATGEHAYLNVDTDIILTQQEAEAALGLY